MGILEQIIETFPALLNEARAIHAQIKVYVLATENVHLRRDTGCTIRYSDWYSANDVAKYLGFDAQFVRKITVVELPYRMFGTDRRYRGIDVLRYDGTLSNVEYEELKKHLNPLTIIKTEQSHSTHLASVPNRFKQLQADSRKIG